MTIEEKLQHFYDSSIEEAYQEASQMIEEHKKNLDAMLSEHKRSRRQSAEAEVKAEAENARREVNKALSAQQLMIKRNWTKKQNELKDKLFAEVQNLLEDFVKTPEYDSYLCRKIKDAQDFAGEDELHIYLTPSDSSRLESIFQKTEAALRLADEEFIGGIRAIIPGKNILIDNSFREAFLACKKEFKFDGGPRYE
ncbi:MAG: Archaeal/vacuolar-type H+-ATPase subunit E [Blautia sp.]